METNSQTAADPCSIRQAQSQTLQIDLVVSKADCASARCRLAELTCQSGVLFKKIFGSRNLSMNPHSKKVFPESLTFVPCHIAKPMWFGWVRSSGPVI